MDAKRCGTDQFEGPHGPLRDWGRRVSCEEQKETMGRGNPHPIGCWGYLGGWVAVSPTVGRTTRGRGHTASRRLRGAVLQVLADDLEQELGVEHRVVVEPEETR